jgi:hypothetical protein
MDFAAGRGSRSRSLAVAELARRPHAPGGGKAAATVPIGAGPPSERRRQWRGPAAPPPPALSAGRGDSGVRFFRLALMVLDFGRVINLT